MMVEGSLLFTAETAVGWSGGTLHGYSGCSVFSVEVDSRNCRAGSLFFALVGERVDGHDFLDRVFENGACGAIVSNDWAGRNEDTLSGLISGERFVIAVEDPLRALQLIAAAYMKGISHPVRVGITGSNGKTTTKEVVAAVLAQKYSVLKTAGNYNSEIGLPLTVFSIKDSHDYAVIEMGVNRVGEMDVLSEILRPDIVVITNIGTAHIGIFKDIDTIASQKRQAVSRFTGDGILFIHEDEPYAGFLSEDLKGDTVFYGENSIRAHGDILKYRNLGIKGWEISLNDQLIKFPLIGGHNLQNSFCSIEVGRFAGIADSQIKKALEEIEPLFGRSQIIDGPVTIIQDCYNANADSLRHSLEFADGVDWPGARLYILGDMKELGNDSAGIHRAAGRAAALCAADEVIFFGDDSLAAYNEAAMQLRKNGRAFPVLYHTADFDELRNRALNDLKTGDLLLLKGSRTMNLERLLEPIANKFRGSEC